jgi:UDP-N-acetylglucosamine 1-carboxyvinyltransferase
VPEITDVRRLVAVFRAIGSEVTHDVAMGTLEVQHRELHFDPLLQGLLREMRSSFCACHPCWRASASLASRTT